MAGKSDAVLNRERVEAAMREADPPIESWSELAAKIGAGRELMTKWGLTKQRPKGKVRTPNGYHMARLELVLRRSSAYLLGLVDDTSSAPAPVGPVFSSTGTAVAFMALRPIDKDLWAKIEKFQSEINREQEDRTRALKEQGRRGKKL